MDTEQTTPSSQPATTEVQDQLRWLRRQLLILIVLAIFISGTLNVYLLRQWRAARADLNGIRPQATQLVAEYNRSQAPAIDMFIKNLQDYGRGHPDFVPILVKYGLGPTNAAAGLR